MFPNIALSSLTRPKGDRDPVPNWRLLGVDFVERYGSEAGADCGVKITFDPLLRLEVFVGNGVCSDTSGCCIGWISNMHNDG